MALKKGPAPVCVVLVTCPNRRLANTLARELVGRRLAACVNLVPGVESTFRWQGKVNRCRETLLIIKTAAAAVERLRRAVIALHPYEVPEFLALSIRAGHRPYLQWIRDSLRTS